MANGRTSLSVPIRVIGGLFICVIRLIRGRSLWFRPDAALVNSGDSLFFFWLELV